MQELVDQGKDYDEIGRILGIPPGEAYLIATGSPADNSAGTSHAPRQELSNPKHENPTASDEAEEMARQRATTDTPMQQAKVEQSYGENIEEATKPSLFERMKQRFSS